MTTVPAPARLTASSTGYSTLPSPSTPYTALHNPSASSAARPYTPMTAVPPKRYPDYYVGGQNRAVRGKIFPDEYLRDRQHSACYRYRVHQPDSLRPAQYADLSVAEYLRGVAQDATKIKDHRVLNTYPRDPPTWSRALIQDTKLALGQAEPALTDEVPMWDLQYIDSPWNDYQAHFKSVAAHDQEWRRQVKSHKVEMEAQWKEEEEREKRLATTGGGARVGSAAGVVAPAGPGPAAAAAAGTPNGLPGAPSMPPGTPAPPTAAPSTPLAGGEARHDSQPAPSATATKKQKGGANGAAPPKPPTLSKAAQQANARKLEEQRSAQQMTQELTRSMGRKRKAWMLGGTPGASSPSTPTADLLGKKKRKLGEGKPDPAGADLTGSPMPSKTASGVVPGSPVPLGKRAGSTFTAAIPSGLNPHAKRMKSVAPEETSSPAATGVKTESGTPAPEQDPAATSKDILDFPSVPDSMTMHDVRTAYRRRIRHGGAFKRVLEQRHEVMLLEIARREHTRYVAQQGGGALGKKEAKPGLLSLGRR